MAIYYIDEDLTTGLNDGSSRENAYQSWSTAMAGIGTLIEDSSIYFYSTGVVDQNRRVSTTLNGFNLTIEFMSGAIALNTSGFVACMYIDKSNASGKYIFKNARFKTTSNAYGLQLTQATEIEVFNMEFIGTSAKRAIYNNTSATILVDGMVSTGSEYAIGNTSTGTINAYNCYGNATVQAFYNAGSGTLNLTTCASNDTSGSVGLQNIAYDTSTFTNITSGTEDFTLVDGSPLIASGTITDSLTDINGTAWSTSVRDIGTVAYSTEDASVDFSYDDINDGFAGFFNFVDDPNIRKFGRNALWFGKITGSSATLAITTGTTPYVIYVDGVQATPTASGGRIELFSGLSDIEHTVCIISKTSAINNWNGISITGTDTIKVTGSAPAITNLGMNYGSDPLFTGINTFSTDTKDYADLTPTYNEVIKNNYEVGQLIVQATCDELYIYTDSTGVWYSVDNADPTEVTFPEDNTESGLTVRRAVRVALGLDDTTSHKYTIWSTDNDTYGIQGIVALKDGVVVTLEAVEAMQKALVVGASVVNGTAGATAGEADTWEVGRRLNLAMVKAGADGTPVTQTILDMPDILTYNGKPDIIIFGSSTNDSGTSEELQADYEAFINYCITAGIETIICRGVVPYWEDRNTALNNAVTNIGNDSVYFVTSENLGTIETVDGTHPTAIGYGQVADYFVPLYDPIINPVITYSLSGVTYDKEGNIATSVQVSLFKHSGGGVYSYISTQTSDATTGAYDFTGLTDNDSSYMIYAHLDDTINTFDCSDNNLTPTEV